MEEQFSKYQEYLKAVLNLKHTCYTTLQHNLSFPNEEESVRKYEIEKILDYGFKDKLLLCESFSSSIIHERLEYLGDAILDWILFLDIYETYRDLLTPLIIYGILFLYL